MQIRRWKADRAESSEDDAKHLATVFQGNSVFLFQIKMDAYLLVKGSGKKNQSWICFTDKSKKKSSCDDEK